MVYVLGIENVSMQNGIANTSYVAIQEREK